jgi:hypothetical protein
MPQYNHLMIQNHLYSLSPPVFPLNQTYTLLVLLLLFSLNLTYGDLIHSMFRISCIFSIALVIPGNLSNSEAKCNIFKMLFFYSKEFLVPQPTPKLKNHPLFSAG